MNYEVIGKLIVKDDVQNISEKFRKREFVIEVENEQNQDWNDFVKVQLTQDRCDLIENIKLNEMIKVSFNLRGRKWENNGKSSYFTNLEGWRVERTDGNDNKAEYKPSKKEEPIPDNTDTDDLPFN